MKQNTAKGNNNPGKINLVKNISVNQKCIHGRIDAICKIGPNDSSRKIKQKGWNAICWNFCYTAEDDKKNKCGKERLKKYPYRAQNCLLITRDDVASHKS